MYDITHGQQMIAALVFIFSCMGFLAYMVYDEDFLIEKPRKRGRMKRKETEDGRSSKD